jgi:glycosyltransferase involved in cell wall biosynthesis
LFARGARRLIAISDAVRRFLVDAGQDPARLTTVHYGLDEGPSAPSNPSPEEAGILPDTPLAVAVGRLIAQKDHPTLLRAFALVREQVPGAQLAILGSGPLETETRGLADALGLSDAVTMPGRVEVRDWLERADVFVHTSRWEGFGIVLLEAMLASLPVVAVRVSAVPEIVLHDKTGVLADAGDTEALAAGITGLLSDPQHARRLGQAGLARARSEFSVARMVDRTLDVYRDARP